MEKIIKTIATQLLSKLSKDRIYYTQKNLSDYGFPQFLIKRITFHLVRELNSEFHLPGEEWLNRESDELLAEWAELQRTIKREIQLPAILAEMVVEKSVRECIGMTIQPRKVIPQLLFEDRVELDTDQLTENSAAITVNRFLVWSMVRYMEKKNRSSLNITDATRIIESIDDKIVQGYHPLNWLSLVKPLYELSGSTVHSDLFRRFFEHKGKNHLAKEFDLIDDEIRESRFIEILSSPNSMHVKGYKDDQQTLFQEEHDEDKVIESPKVLIENQDDMIEDLPDNTPIFQTFREDSVEESDEWDEDTAEKQVADSGVEGAEEQIAASGVEVEEEQIAEPGIEFEEEQLEEPEEEITEEQIAKPEVDNAKEQISESNVEVEEEKASEQKVEVSKEQVSESEEEVAEEQIAEPGVEGAEEQVSESKVEVTKEQNPESDEKEEKEDVRDEELRAPWDEEEEDSYTFLTHDENEDSPDSILRDLNKEEQEELSEEENEFPKKEVPTSDAALLEINDDEVMDGESDEEALFSRFKSIQDLNESITGSDEDDTEESDSTEESEVVNREEDSESDDELDEDALYSRFKLIQDQNLSIPESDEDDVEESDSIEESADLGVDMGYESVEESEEGDSSLLNRFMFDDSDNDDSLANMESDGDKKVTTIYDELNLVRNNVEPETMDLFGSLKKPESEEKTSRSKPVDKNSGTDMQESESIQKFSDIEKPESEEDSNDTEVPMWRSFLERDEKETKSVFQFDDKSVSNVEGLNVEESDEKLDEDGFIEEPIYDFTKKEPDLDEKIGDLSNWMKDVREKFIEELFGDSEDAYEQSLADIMEYDDWKNASKYIEKEIFTRNRIDVYDEIAVEFTDRLHSYFIENKS